MDKRILLVEDEEDTREAVSEFLSEAGFQVTVAKDGEIAMELLRNNLYDMVVLDIMLPKVNGFVVLNWLRKRSQVPVLMLTAMHDEYTQLMSFDEQADDYITKPFSVSELIARLEALTRRIHRGSGTAARPAEEPEQLVSGPFVLDEKSRILYKSGKPIDLTQVEFQIMELFFRNPGTALVREKILEVSGAKIISAM